MSFWIVFERSTIIVCCQFNSSPLDFIVCIQDLSYLFVDYFNNTSWRPQLCILFILILFIYFFYCWMFSAKLELHQNQLKQSMTHTNQEKCHLKCEHLFLILLMFCCLQIRHEVSFKTVTHKICSDACFNVYRRANGLIMNCCEQCGDYLPSRASANHSLLVDGQQKRFCCQNCIREYKQVSQWESCDPFILFSGFQDIMVLL